MADLNLKITTDRTMLNTGRTLSLIGDITQAMYERVAMEHSYLVGLNLKPILAMLDSDGGDPDAAWGMASLFSASPVDVYLVAQRAYSAAGDLLVLGPPGRRYIMENGSVMIHRARAGMEGDVRERRASQEFDEAQEERIVAAIAAVSRYRKSSLLKQIDTHSLWLDADAAVKKRLVDGYWTAEISDDVYRKIRGKR